MSLFTGELTITETHLASRVWRLEQELHYEIGSLGSGAFVVVPAGFMTDGASVPRALWSVFPSWGTYSRAAVVHDFVVHLINTGQPHPLALTRAAADKLFMEAMKVCQTGWFTRHCLYLGVRWGAYFGIRKNIVDVVNT
jgi:hypothetical protein